LQRRDLQGASDGELVALYGEVMTELAERGIVRSGNQPIADMAERVIADYYGVEPEPPNQKSSTSLHLTEPRSRSRRFGEPSLLARISRRCGRLTSMSSRR
jgi:hypothetical protein